MKVGSVFEKREGLSAEGLEVSGLGKGFLAGGGVEDAFFENAVGELLAVHRLVV